MNVAIDFGVLKQGRNYVLDLAGFVDIAPPIANRVEFIERQDAGRGHGIVEYTPGTAGGLPR